MARFPGSLEPHGGLPGQGAMSCCEGPAVLAHLFSCCATISILPYLTLPHPW